jgi:sugar phosphate isomerase/epimerase
MDLARFTCCTYPLRAVPYAEAFARLASTGLRRLDVFGCAPHFSPDPAECDPDAFESAARAAGVTIANLGTYVGQDFDAPEAAKVDAELARAHAVLNLAARFGCRSVRALPGHGADPALIAKIAPRYREIMGHAEALGIYLGIENHAGSLAGDPELALRLCEAVGSRWFGVLYEPCNLLHGGVDYRAAFAVFRTWITHVHLKDLDTSGPQPRRCHLGEGAVDLRWCLDALGESGYAGDFALEYELEDGGSVEAGLVRWREYVEGL